MNDKELLLAAAKAAGYDDAEFHSFDGMETRHGLSEAIWSDKQYKETSSGFWNPLFDDGHALVLAVKLKIDIKQYDDHVVGWFHGGYIGTGQIMYEGDPYAATRRAIVRAAASISEK
jgi:hypothetical protein